MKTLFINGCVREESRTILIARRLLEKLGCDYEELDLNEEKLLPLDRDTLKKRSDLAMEGNFDDPMFRYAKQFTEAENVIIAAPYWDLSIPACIKTWIELIDVVGLTFHDIDDDQPRTLGKGKRLIYVMTSGGTVVSHDLGWGYLKIVFREFFNFEEFVYLKTEKLDLTGADVDALLTKAFDDVDEYVSSVDKTTF